MIDASETKGDQGAAADDAEPIDLNADAIGDADEASETEKPSDLVTLPAFLTADAA